MARDPGAFTAIGRAITELSAGAGRVPGRPHWRAAPCLGALALIASPMAIGAPQDGTVAAGQAQIARNGNLTSISQQSQRAVIDWRSFSVGASEAVEFRQPSTSAVTLNRVLGSDPSAILGRLTANGTVFLVNPNGVLFGQGAQVNVGGIVASTANISNANFMAGIDRFDQPGDANATVENRGVIRVADLGIAALVGRRVANSGFIVARLGKVALAAGDAFVLDLTGERLVSLVLDPGTLERVTDAQGQPLAARVDQTGNIQAAGGRVELTADTVSRLLNNVINVGGDIRATTAEARDGVIRITGGTGTDVTLAGVVQAGGAGGRVSVAGRDILLASAAQVDIGTGASLRLDAARNITLDAALNGLAAGALAGGGVTAVAGNDLAVNATVATANGTIDLAATAGRLSVAEGQLLQAGDQPITLGGGAGVTTRSVLTSGAIAITSAAGAVDVRGTLGAPGSAGAAGAAGATQVQGRDGVTLAGVRTGGALTVGSAVGSVALTGAVDAAGAVNITATTGTLTVGEGGIRVSGAGQGLSLQAGGPLRLDGDLIAHSGSITLASTSGAVTARVTNPGANPQAADATIDAGADATQSQISVTARGDVTLGGMVAHGGITVRSDTGNVLLLAPLGGANTGYMAYADGYQAALRPDVGTLAIEAPNGSVELNGLNLDGLRNATDSGHGLSVVAGRMVLSNDIIAVNKGDVLLQGGNTLATDGVYLGGNVFSRGFDQLAGGVRNKIGYGIRIVGRNLGVFDNTDGQAELPGLFRVTLTLPFVFNGQTHMQVLTDQQGRVVDVNGQRLQANGQFFYVACTACSDPVTLSVLATNDPAVAGNVLGQPARRTVARIEIANNVANYRVDDAGTAGIDERSALVGVTGTGVLPQVRLEVTSIGGVTNVAVPSDGAARQSLATFQPVLGGLSEAAARVTPDPNSTAAASTRGVVIKLLGFEGATDASTELWNATLAQPLIARRCATDTPPPCDAVGNQAGLIAGNGSTTYEVQLFVPPRGFSPPNISQTYTLTTGTITQPWTHLGSSGGRFQVGVQGSFRLVGGAPLVGVQNAVYTFELEGNARFHGFTAPSRTARVVGITVNGVTGNWESIPTVTGVEPVGLSRVVNVVFGYNAPMIVSEPGRASGVRVAGVLAGSTAFAGGVANGDQFLPTAPVSVPPPLFIQSATGQLSVVTVTPDATRGYTFGRVTLESSAVPGAFGSDQRGTRVVLFDGILGNATGGALSDQNGSALHIPGFTGIPGTNNSTTGFSSVGGSTAAIGGAQVQAGSVVGAAPVPPSATTFEFRPTFVDDRASQDALGGGAAGAGAGEGAATRAALGPGLQVGTGPTRQADLGRGNGLGGAAPNIFKRAYRLAVAVDTSVCNPEAIEPPAPAGAGAVGAVGAVARPCQPASK
ncbi:MAG: filamentous hemagglutinin N-terminal domain-containing protein [Rubrivivax sp.]|nr:filamentous hemagglutinin N-terminal domain-containing protein [Rubrivivax sp.]